MTRRDHDVARRRNSLPGSLPLGAGASTVRTARVAGVGNTAPKVADRQERWTHLLRAVAGVNTKYPPMIAFGAGVSDGYHTSLSVAALSS